MSLSGAVGDFSGKGEASALHARCLVCDKPVTSLSGVLNPSRQRNPNQIGYDKIDDAIDDSRPHTAASLLPSSSFDRLASPDKTVSVKEKVKVSTDITVLKNSIDLPHISVRSLIVCFKVV